MDKILQISITCFLFCSTAFINCTSKANNSTLPSITSLDRYTATITWKTQKSLHGVVTYYQEGKEEKKLTEEKATKKHVITLTGLLPDKQYYYKINILPKREFNFRTAPLSTSSFRFCIINRDKFATTMIEHLFPDFLILCHADSSYKNRPLEKLKEIHTRIPFYDIQDTFMWGNLFFHAYGSANSIIDLPAGNWTLFTMCDSLFSDSLPIEKTTNRIIAFLGGDSISVLSDSFGTQFFMADHSMLFEVQGDEISAGVIGSEPDKPLPFHLKTGTLSYTKTCVLCRRLLENKQYTKSIAYYKRFVEENPVQKLHDDALFHIATIYDRYLFDYSSAINTYSQLLDRYPQSAFSGTAGFRLNYIQQHSDFEYIPLKIFEKAKLQFDNTDKNSSVEKVEGILNRYSTCSLRDDILLWLGNILAATEREKAIKYLTLLSEKTDDSVKEYKASLKIGDIYYQHKKYHDAGQVYTTLLKKYPAKYATLQIKINRTIRNQKRKIWLWVCIIFLIVSIVTVFALPGKGLKMPPMVPALYVFSIYFLAFIIPFMLYYDSLNTLKPFTASLCFSMILVLYFSWLLAAKLGSLPIPLALKAGINSMVTLLITICVLFIHLYFFHFLFIFERVLQ